MARPRKPRQNGVMDWLGLGPSHTTYKVDGEYGTYKRKVGRPSSRSTSSAGANGETVESYRGYNIIHTRGEKGYFVPDLDDTGEGFRSKDDAKLFIAAKTSKGNKQRNPRMAKQKNPRKRVWNHYFSIQGNYGYGWEEVTAEDTWKEARARLKEYRENQPGAYRVVRKKERIEESQSNPSNTDGWIPAHAVRMLPSGDIQLLTERGTMSNPGKRKSFLKKVSKVFGKVVKTGKGMIGNPSTDKYQVVIEGFSNNWVSSLAKAKQKLKSLATSNSNATNGAFFEIHKKGGALLYSGRIWKGYLSYF